MCVLYLLKEGGGGRQSLARKIRVGQEPRKRKEKRGVLSGHTAFCSRSHGGPLPKWRTIGRTQIRKIFRK